MSLQPLTIRAYAAVIPAREPTWDTFLAPALKRRTPRIWQLALCATGRVLRDQFPTPVSVVAATALGALDETKNFLDTVFVDGFASPRHFIASVHNSMAGKIATDHQILGANLTLCEGANSLAAAVAAAQLFENDNLPVLIVAVEERIELLDRLGPHLSAECREYFGMSDWQDGAVALLCDRSGTGPQLRAIGPQIVNGATPESTCRELAATLPTPTARFISPSQAALSPFEPAIVLADSLAHGSGPLHIGSYCPSSGSCAVIELCP